MRRSSSGISPVVATVILVAIAIVIAIAVAFWASGLVGIFTRFEKLEVIAAVPDGTGNVELLVKNTGSSSATIDDIYVNGVPLGRDGVTFTNDGNRLDATNPPAQNACPNAGPCRLQPGEDIVIDVDGPEGADSDWTPGVTYEIAVHTASGKTYPIAVLIP